MSEHDRFEESGEPAEILAPEPVSEAIPSTRVGRIWLRILPALVLLGLTMVFVLQNRNEVAVSFISWSVNVPLGVALLLAFVVGAAVVLALGSLRILQLRRLVHKNARSWSRSITSANTPRPKPVDRG